MVTETRLDPKTEAVLARFCERLGFRYKTQAVKLPYLADVVAKHVLDRRLVDLRFQAWDQGVVAPEIYKFFTHHREPDPVFRVEPAQYSESAVRISLRGAPQRALTDEEREIVDFVADEYGRLPVEQLGRVTKRLNTELPIEKWGSNAEVRIDEEAYLRLSPHWQELYESIAASDLNDQSLWGEPIEDSGEYLRRALA